MEILQVIYPSQFNLCEARGMHLKEEIFAYSIICQASILIVTGERALCITTDTRVL